MSSNITKMLERVRKDFQKTHKKEINLLNGNDVGPVYGLDVDEPLLEYILDRRVMPYGRCYLTYGKKGCSKTSFSLDIFKRVQKAGGQAIWIETEHAADLDFARDQGVNMDSLYMSHPNTFEEGLDTAIAFAENLPMFREENGGAPIVICFDSLAGKDTNYGSNQDGLGQYKPGEHAKLLAEFYRKMTGLLDGENVLFLATNQLKEAIGGMSGFGQEKPESMIGGEAPRFHSTYQLKVARIADMTKELPGGTKRKVGSVHNMVAKRNKLGREGSSQNIEYDLYIKGGIDWRSPLVRKLGKEYDGRCLNKGAAGYYEWQVEGCTVLDAEGKPTMDIPTKKKMREAELGGLIAKSPLAKDVIRDLFELRPKPTEEEFSKTLKEIEKTRAGKKKKGGKEEDDPAFPQITSTPE